MTVRSPASTSSFSVVRSRRAISCASRTSSSGRFTVVFIRLTISPEPYSRLAFAASPSRLELPRELHDVAAHHLSGMVLQAHAARIIQRKAPQELDESVASIEMAGAEALAAIRRVVGLLRETTETGRPRSEQLGELIDQFERHGPVVRQLAAAVAPAGDIPLSGRELDVVRAIARGRTNQEIVAELFISLSTVKSHLSGISGQAGPAQPGRGRRLGVGEPDSRSHLSRADHDGRVRRDRLLQVLGGQANSAI
ncbi:helix-turn-helix transcriptional regulator [Fodinicola feengrottensis]|uniref:helix-turn-helix transcriptional regulator n=1 Tax=Fodinicola feengrottensis TaxID=435914 RepID=UPI0031D1F756